MLAQNEGIHIKKHDNFPQFNMKEYEYKVFKINIINANYRRSTDKIQYHYEIIIILCM